MSKHRTTNNGKDELPSYKCSFDEEVEDKLKDYAHRNDQTVRETILESVDFFLDRKEKEEQE